MARSARANGIGCGSRFLAGCVLFLCCAHASGPLEVTFDGDNLRMAAPGLHFLTGKPLERLRNADTVTFLSQLTLFSDESGTVLRRIPERLIVSYDLWQEKFSVTIPGSYKRSAVNLSAAQAEAWCMDNLVVSALGLPPERPFWLTFELRTADRRELASLVGDSGISLSRLIDIFSHPQGGDLYWTRSAGPLRLRDLPRTPSGRGRTG